MDNIYYDTLGVRDRLIMDPVHGGITLFAHEIAVIDHPLFQRLRYICQNDILSFVFPGATHSRFLHSIGTMHVGHRMYLGLIESACKKRRKLGKELSHRHLVAIGFFNKLVRLACLLHDCGHSSFSHQFSQVPAIAAMLEERGRFNALWEAKDVTPIYSDPDIDPSPLEHEHYSVRCSHQILESIASQLPDFSPLDVLALMETTRPTATPQFERHSGEVWELLTGEPSAPENAAQHISHLFSLLVSGEIDADRADYMLRDSFHSSVTMGGINLDHLLKNLHIGWDASKDWMGLAVTKKGLGALEDFVYSRHQMYRKVYGHKTSIGFDWVLRRAIDEVMQQPPVCAYISAALSDIQEFAYLTDNYFWEQFRLYSRQHPSSYSSMMMHRTKLEHLHSMENVAPEELDEKLEKVARFNQLKTEQIVLCEMKARFSKIRDGFTHIKVLKKTAPDYEANSESSVAYSPITEESSFFGKFTDGNIVHFYKRPFTPSIP